MFKSDFVLSKGFKIKKRALESNQAPSFNKFKFINLSKSSSL